MRVLLSTYSQKAELVAIRHDTTGPVSEERGAPVATSVMPSGGWQ